MRGALFASREARLLSSGLPEQESTKVIRRKICPSHQTLKPHGEESCLHHRVQASREGYEKAEEEITGSPAWHSRKRARTLPSLARTPEQTFVLAGVLKILLLASTFPAAYIFTPLGRTPRGFTAYLLLIPFGIVLSYLAGAINKANFMRRKWSGIIIVLGASLLMTGLGYLYDVRPLPAPKPRTTQPVEDHWSQNLFQSARKKTAEDSDKIWREMEKDGLV